MLRRVVCLAAAVLICVGSASAWTAESFTGWDFGQVSDEPFPEQSFPDGDSMVPFADSPNDILVNGICDPSLLTFSGSVNRDYTMHVVAVPGYPASSYKLSQIEFFSGVCNRRVDSGYYFPVFDFSSLETDGEYVYHTPSSAIYASGTIRFDLPISTDEGTSLELSFRFAFPSSSLPRVYWYGHSSTAALMSPVSMDIYVNDVVVYTMVGSSFDNASFLYSSTEAIQSCYIVFTLDRGRSSFPEDLLGYSLCPYFYFLSDSFLSYSFLDGIPVLDVHNDKAQDSINQHEAYESQWSGNMTESFGGLDIPNFKFVTGLADAFRLLAGIVQDLYNALGDYKILYVFPLTLGVVLLVVGRMSKYDGRGSSSSPPRIGSGTGLRKR